jgi:hypothetical protein
MHDNFETRVDAGAELGDKLSGDSVTAEADMRVVQNAHDITVVREGEVFIFETDGDAPLMTLAAGPDETPDDVFFAVEELPFVNERDERGRRPTFVSAELNERRKSGEMHQPPRVAASLAN